MKIFTKQNICCMALLVSVTLASAATSTTTTSSAIVTHEIHFERNSDRISVEEIRALVDWKIEILRLRGLLHLGIYLKTDSRLDVPLRIAEKRLDAIALLMNTLGFKIYDAAIEDFNVPNAARRLTQKEANTAVVAIPPPCMRALTC